MALNKSSGRTLCWGGSDFGAACPDEDLLGVTEVYSTQRAFLAVNKVHGNATCWGDAVYGGNMTQCSAINFTTIVNVYRTDLAFMALNRDIGQATCWGRMDSGGNCSGLNFSGVTHVINNYAAFVAWGEELDSPICWGAAQHGGNCIGINMSGITNVYSTDAAFLAINRDTGQGQCWGSSWRGGSGTCENLDFRGLINVFSSYRAFMGVWREEARIVHLGGIFYVWIWPALFLLSLGFTCLGIVSIRRVRKQYKLRRCASLDFRGPLPPWLFDRVQRWRERSEHLAVAATCLQAEKGCFTRQKARRFKNKAFRLCERAESALAAAALKVAGGPENWAITVEQLVEFFKSYAPEINSYCKDHRLCTKFSHVCMVNPCPHEHGDAEHKLAHMETDAELQTMQFNMHAVVGLFLKPQTKGNEGIFGYWSRMNMDAPLRADTFVSHCWNQLFSDFVAAVSTLRPSTALWICSFALPQNVNISKVLGSSPFHSPFAVALRQADRLIMAVDDAVQPLRRSWCCFEVYLAVTQRTRIDIRAHVQSVKLYQTITDQVSTMDIRQCTASNAADHEMIMQCIRGKEDIVNDKIRVQVEETADMLRQVVP
eukprot:TRINITY_DN5857_c0_g2_i1.p1 TRINITY_DN5857_c0_g2~~TRINITY_DN5857_c0_g2_i1.p1  ORF type:complete len:698 (+),score=57.56 TRINITY_DN5857_c0_g2_i1:299-2095(+)